MTAKPKASAFALPALRSLGELAGSPPVIVVDTREQDPLPFSRMKSQAGTLATGDYSLADHGDWLLRAAAALAGIYGNDAVEAMYPLAVKDIEGRKLDGSKYSYTLTFPVGQLPPVNAFWSVTMYDGKTQLLVANSINRYLINSPMLPEMKKNPDGSLTLYIQKESPGAGKESNWLPAPDGPIYLVMRLY